MPSASSDAFDQTVTRIPSCALDEVGKREQRARYVLLASSVRRIEPPAQHSVDLLRPRPRSPNARSGVER